MIELSDTKWLVQQSEATNHIWSCIDVYTAISGKTVAQKKGDPSDYDHPQGTICLWT